MKSTLAIIGLAVMGQNLARNFSRFFTTSVYNRTMSVTHEFIEKYGSETLR
jgi:6-phosphogluconate dehydrogenase